MAATMRHCPLPSSVWAALLAAQARSGFTDDHVSWLPPADLLAKIAGPGGLTWLAAGER
jgi:hypothetical protein